MIDESLAPLATLDRMRALADYNWLDPELRCRLDRICQRTADRLNASTSMVSIVLDGAQFLAGSYGVHGWIAEAQGTPVEWAFCARAVLSRKPAYVVCDATTHPLHRDSPLVTGEGTRSYAGVPIPGPEGHILGMHCVTDDHARMFTDRELQGLCEARDEIGRILQTYRLQPCHPLGRTDE